MNKLFRNKAFRYGIISAFTLAFLVQIVSFIDYIYSIKTFKNPPGINIDMIWSYGLPFPIYYGYTNGFIWWRGILANLVIATIFSFIIGLIFKLVSENLTAKRVQ